MADRMSERAASCSSTEREDDLESNAATEIVDGSASGLESCSDEKGWEAYDSDENIPDPDEIRRMSKSGPAFDWSRVSKVVKGPICWKCYSWSPFFCCEKCDRRFHRECVLMSDGFPDPIFDKPLDEAYMANYNEARLLKCSICIISETTQVNTFCNLSQSELNQKFFLIARYVHAEFGIDVLPNIRVKGITTTDIQEKASRGEYVTIEGFYSDYRMMELNIVKKYARQSEELEVVRTVLNTVELYLNVMLSCVDCVTNYFNPEGRLYSAKDFSFEIRKPCSEPHVVVWAKEGTFPFWPAKMLAHDPVKKIILIQFFGERAVAKKFPYPSDEIIVVQTYSSVFPGRKPRKSEKTWTQACAECRDYLKNIRKKIGEKGVIVPQDSVKFDGDLDAYKRAMFPLSVLENKQIGNENVPVHNPGGDQKAT